MPSPEKNQKRPLRVLFDANPLLNEKTGVGYFTSSLIEHLARSYPDSIELVGHYFNFRGKKQPAALPKASNIHYVSTQLFPTKLLNILRRAGIELPIEYFARTKADVHLFTNFVSFPSLDKTPSMLFVHDTSFEDVPSFVADRNGSFLRRFVPVSINRASIIVTISNFSAARIKTLYSPKKKIEAVAVPPNKPLKSSNEVLRSLHIPKEYLLFVGTIEPRKNIETLLDALPLIYEKTQISLVLAGGKGWKDDVIQEKLKKLEHQGIPVISTGYVTDEQKAALYSGAKLYIQPSHYEGFGMPILEAMSYGLPVVCSDIDVFKEVAGESALYFSAPSSKSLADTVLKAMSNNKQSELRTRSKQRIAAYPTWDHVSRQVYKELRAIANFE